MESVKNDLPEADELYDIMVKAGCVTKLADAHLSPEFALEALRYSPFMRRRITLLRILPLLGIKEDVLKL